MIHKATIATSLLPRMIPVSLLILVTGCTAKEQPVPASGGFDSPGLMAALSEIPTLDIEVFAKMHYTFDARMSSVGASVFSGPGVIFTSVEDSRLIEVESSGRLLIDGTEVGDIGKHVELAVFWTSASERPTLHSVTRHGVHTHAMGFHRFDKSPLMLLRFLGEVESQAYYFTEDATILRHNLDGEFDMIAKLWPKPFFQPVPSVPTGTIVWLPIEDSTLHALELASGETRKLFDCPDMTFGFIYGVDGSGTRIYLKGLNDFRSLDTRNCTEAPLWGHDLLTDVTQHPTHPDALIVLEDRTLTVRDGVCGAVLFSEILPFKPTMSFNSIGQVIFAEGPQMTEWFWGYPTFAPSASTEVLILSKIGTEWNWESLHR